METIINYIGSDEHYNQLKQTNPIIGFDAHYHSLYGNKNVPIHRLRWYVDSKSSKITDEELDEIESKMNFDAYLNEEYSGNFIFTKNLNDREAAVENMSYGIITEDIELANGETVYFAFDYDD